jgi:3-oxoacyl-[acyl-carrier protein] reductase
MNLNLADKRILVTGGSRGLGRAIIASFLAEGARVATCARGEAGLNLLRTELSAPENKLLTRAIDVRDGDAFAGWVKEAVDAMGGLDIVISNVSTRLTGNDTAWWKESFETDFLQHAHLTELATPHLLNGSQPSIVYVSSIASVLTNLPPDELAYGVMKAGLVNYSGQMAARLGPKGVRVNTVSPGPIFFKGGTWDSIKAANPRLFEAAASLPALARHGTPEEVANTVVFLASPAASYITGANVRVDGGAIRTANF